MGTGLILQEPFFMPLAVAESVVMRRSFHVLMLEFERKSTPPSELKMVSTYMRVYRMQRYVQRSFRSDTVDIDMETFPNSSASQTALRPSRIHFCSFSALVT